MDKKSKHTFWVDGDNCICLGQKILGIVDSNLHEDNLLKKQAIRIFKNIEKFNDSLSKRLYNSDKWIRLKRKFTKE